FPLRKGTFRETRLCIATVKMLVSRHSRSGFFSHLRTFAVLLFAPFVFTTAAHAQTGIYVEYGGSKVDAPSNDWIYGPTFGLYHDFYSVPLVHVGGDLRGSVLGVSQTTTLTSGMIGPRVSVHPHVLPAMPYLEALGGIGHYDYGASQGSNTQFEYQFLAGIDITVLPRLDWRAVEFSYGGLSALNGTLHPRTLSMGLVLRLP
ncbi:MAG: hypothetical protein ACJ71S_00885, partial [Acidobacteriaceae bacterium]